MLTAMLAVENILSGRKDKQNLWQVNTEQEYHEEKKTSEDVPQYPTTPRESDLSDEEFVA